jgi:UDP-glucose 4-epimerase
VASLTGKSILVTGGAGFIGSHIVDLLADESCRGVVVVDNFVRGAPENLASARPRANVSIVQGDIRHRDLMRDLIGAADIVFHLAALRITHCAAEPREAFDIMVDATFELAKMCADAAIEKVVYASSASIYGMADSFPTSERHHSHEDRTLYGAAKMFGEGVLRALAVPHIALRYFNVYGPRMDIHGHYTEVLVRWMERIDAGLPPVIFGDGMQTMDFIDVRDVARANLLAAKAEPADGAFNVASGVETSLLQLAEELARVMGRPRLTPEFKAARSVNAVERRLADVEKARRILGFSSEIPLSEGLRDLVAWWRAQRHKTTAVSEQRATS